MHRSGVSMAWNVFKFCTALRGLGSIMILLVLGVVGVSYYAVVWTNYGPALYAGGLDSCIALGVLITFHCLLVMLLWSYYSVVFTDPGAIPANWRPIPDEERGEADPLSNSDFNSLQSDPSNPRVRYCRKCNQLKPPRCHHCSVCGRCVLKMDHHCVWAVNYKYFLLFLFYTFLETTLVTLALLPHFIAFFNDEEIAGTPGTLATTFLAFVLNLAFALSVMGFLIMHISLVLANTTTIEAYEKKTSPKWRYDLGKKKNFEQVWYESHLAENVKDMVANSNILLSMEICNYRSTSFHHETLAAMKADLQLFQVSCQVSLLFLKFDFHGCLCFKVFGMDKRFWFVPAYSEEDLRRMPELQGL